MTELPGRGTGPLQQGPDWLKAAVRRAAPHALPAAIALAAILVRRRDASQRTIVRDWDPADVLSGVARGLERPEVAEVIRDRDLHAVSETAYEIVLQAATQVSQAGLSPSADVCRLAAEQAVLLLLFGLPADPVKDLVERILGYDPWERGARHGQIDDEQEAPAPDDGSDESDRSRRRDRGDSADTPDEAENDEAPETR